MINKPPIIKEIEETIKKAAEVYKQLTLDQLTYLELILPSFKNNDAGNLYLLIGFLTAYIEMVNLCPELQQIELFAHLVNEKFILYIGKLSKETQDKLVMDYVNEVKKFFEEEPQVNEENPFQEWKELDENSN